MAGEDSGGRTTRGFFHPLTTFLETVLAIVQTRLDLLFTELEEERERVKEIVLLALVSLFCLSLGVLLLTLFVVAIFWETHRLSVLAGLAVIYLGVATAVGLILRKKAMSKPRLFSATMAELSKDRERLKP